MYVKKKEKKRNTRTSAKKKQLNKCRRSRVSYFFPDGVHPEGGVQGGGAAFGETTQLVNVIAGG